MGKNSAINSLGKCIGNIAMHKLLLKHTSKPESLNFLNNEIREYSADALEKAREYNWNDADRQELSEKAAQRVKTLGQYYPDISLIQEEVNFFIEETMNELFD